jgi:hypothetical protein
MMKSRGSSKQLFKDLLFSYIYMDTHANCSSIIFSSCTCSSPFEHLSTNFILGVFLLSYVTVHNISSTFSGTCHNPLSLHDILQHINDTSDRRYGSLNNLKMNDKLNLTFQWEMPAWWLLWQKAVLYSTWRHSLSQTIQLTLCPYHRMSTNHSPPYLHQSLQNPG